jgi:hypothetical protein
MKLDKNELWTLLRLVESHANLISELDSAEVEYLDEIGALERKIQDEIENTDSYCDCLAIHKGKCQPLKEEEGLNIEMLKKAQKTLEESDKVYFQEEEGECCRHCADCDYSFKICDKTDCPCHQEKEKVKLPSLPSEICYCGHPKERHSQELDYIRCHGIGNYCSTHDRPERICMEEVMNKPKIHTNCKHCTCKEFYLDETAK